MLWNAYLSAWCNERIIFTDGPLIFIDPYRRSITSLPLEIDRSRKTWRTIIRENNLRPIADFTRCKNCILVDHRIFFLYIQLFFSFAIVDYSWKLFKKEKFLHRSIKIPISKKLFRLKYVYFRRWYEIRKQCWKFIIEILSILLTRNRHRGIWKTFIHLTTIFMIHGNSHTFPEARKKLICIWVMILNKLNTRLKNK